MKKTSVVLLAATFFAGVGASQILRAADGPLYYTVSEIKVKDQAAYENSGVDKLREAMVANGGKMIAGGYNKAELLAGNGEPANRIVIWVYPNNATAGKVWAENIRPWLEKVEGKFATARAIGVEGIGAK